MSDTDDEKQGCLSFFTRLFQSGKQQVPDAEPFRQSSRRQLPYRIRDDFLSPAEFSFYRVMVYTVGDQVFIAPKVRLADIFFIPHGKKNYADQNRIGQKHVDFLLCDRETMKPLAGIELDDSSHQRAKQQARDEFVNQTFKAAGLPLERVSVKRGYTSEEIRAQFARYTSKAVATVPQVERQPTARISSSGAAPICPKCGVPMVIRTVKVGEHKGQQFYGCINYPNCRERKPLHA